MIKFFRKIRQKMLVENKFSKYLIYATGEVVLVVIGILIALSINNCNTQRLNSIKEEHILLEIKDNLNEDLQNIEFVINENAKKIRAIDSGFYFLSKMDENLQRGRKFADLMPILTNHSIFNPTRVAFDNMISTGNTDILLSDEVRKDISRYYSSDLLEGIQDQLIITSQGFLDETAPKLINKTMLKGVKNLDFDIKSHNDIAIHKDQILMSDLLVMEFKSKHHNEILNEMKSQIKALIASINLYIDTK
ncbi:MAG: hypothetical protein HKO01_08330 [Flaviramulus sp.]|nr:DUF6090 family protein [Flaviramulus sp.]NNC50523.1 hypothetical protein [Flaviramulus sp.]